MTTPAPTINPYRSYTAKNGKQVTLRPARIEDAPSIIRRMGKVVREGEYLEEEEQTMADVREEERKIEKMRKKGSMYTVAVVDEEIVAAAELKRGALRMNRHTAEFRIWVGPLFRGMGIGKHLMIYTIDWAKKNGLKKISLDVFANNERAIDLYKRYGFVVEGRRRDHFFINGRYVDEIFMSKFL
ncbi:MAG: GNAT family N-acetyltransferase [Bacillaceae bacterium]|nr:GNAT family N-acetyltransferase [Bacillaceae bacterium]